MTSSSPQPRGRLALTLKALQVRLRFVIVLVVAFVVVGQWGVLRNYWDRLRHRIAGGNSASHMVSDDTEYFCPMDPGVISDWPAICPVCNMDLVRRKKGDAIALPDGVVARMQFSPYRIQLAGIKTSVVESKPLSRKFVLMGRVDNSDTAPRATEDSSPAMNRITATAYEADLPWLTPGKLATIQADAVTGAPPTAVVESVADYAESGGSHVHLRLEPADTRLRPGMAVRAVVSVPLREFEPFRSTMPESSLVLAVPETAVIDTGSRQVVYVESMPGMFDGVEVTVGPRCGDDIPILKGLEAGQRVATAGAFLIDAEARLNPSLAAGYFGANRAGEGASPKPATPSAAPAKRQATAAKSKLSAADRALAKKQKVCPVTDLPLDSMGGPIPVEVSGKRVFICCKGCEGPLKKEPEKFLAKLKGEK